MNPSLHRRARLSFALMLAAVAFGATAAPSPAQVALVEYPAGATFSSPYHVTAPPGDTSRVFVVEGTGTIRVVKDGFLLPEPFLDISDDPDFLDGGERGLLSLAFAPDYATSRRFYVQYTRDSAEADEAHYLITEEFRRSAADPDVADASTRRLVLSIPHLWSGTHNGGQIQFGPDGMLYISTGDGGGGGDPEENAQNKAALLGKILRIDPTGDEPGEYTAPASNPFADAGDPGADEVWSYGLRNPWRFSFDRLTGDLTVGDVGQDAAEEVDFVSDDAGRGRSTNFGWDCREGSIPYSSPGPSCASAGEVFEDPVISYPNPVSGSSAVVGGYVVRDESLPSLVGRYLYADTYAGLGGEIWAANLSDAGATGNATTGLDVGFPVTFGEDACGHVYVASGGGTVYRLEPTGGGFACSPSQPGPPSSPGVVGGVELVNGRALSASRRAKIRWKKRGRRGARRGSRRR